jgi:hypothetical protein
MVAVDAYGYEKLLGRDPTELGYIQMAHGRDLGDKNWQRTNWKEIQV